MSGAEKITDASVPEELQQESLERCVTEAIQAFEQAQTIAELKEARLTHTSDRSPIGVANRKIGKLSPDLRKEAGMRIGEARKKVADALAAREQQVHAQELEARLAKEHVDVTIPVDETPLGAIHPLTAMMTMMSDIFLAMGWEIVDGPEVEAEWFIFDALNMGSDHPARGLRDTFYVEPLDHHKVLRTETSNAQIHSLLNRPLPLYIVSPGRVYRSDEIDATHLPVFNQIEGLAVDKGLSMADLKGTLDHFAKQMFGEVKTRFRPHFFPFTEPSAEMDIECFVCHGASVNNPDLQCRTCKNEGWIEWGGCGVVNPKVLRICGIDTDVYSGFAFGMGIDRALMLRNGVTDIRDIIEGDVRFSRALMGGAR